MSSTNIAVAARRPEKRDRSAMREKGWLNLPEGFNPVDCTIDEAASFRRESRWETHRKMREGIYRFYKEGRRTKIIFASVLADRDRALRDGVAKRQPGRPKKIAP
jgi:hypothetical protein